MDRVSPIFIDREYRIDNILIEHCNKFNIYIDYIKAFERDLRNEFNEQKCYGELKLGKYFIKDNKLDGNIIENFVLQGAIDLGYIDENGRWPNGSMNWPDLVDKKKISFDVKAVQCKPIDLVVGDTQIYSPAYNNACGNRDTVSKEIYEYYKTKESNYIKSLVIFVYYIENKIIEIKIVPTVYTLQLTKDKSHFSVKSPGKNGEVKNANINIGLPSFLQKTGQDTYDEHFLYISTATFNYLNKL